MKNFMQIVHGNQSCSGHFLSFLLQAYKRALPVYLPVYLIPALIVHRKGLLKRWLHFLFPKSCLFSSELFLKVFTFNEAGLILRVLLGKYLKSFLIYLTSTSAVEARLFNLNCVEYTAYLMVNIKWWLGWLHKSAKSYYC